jgi:tetratricopeptide (TPR) repeat protein
MALAEQAAAADAQLLMARVFVATFRLFSGGSPHDVAVAKPLAEAADLAALATERERRHVTALTAAASGEFSVAARLWDQILVDHPGDSFALKASHEAFFLVGLSDEMLDSAERAVSAWPVGTPNLGSALGQRALAREECGRYHQAECDAKLGLDLDRDDVWSAHALAHVYEMLDRQTDAVSFLEGARPHWSEQALAGHMWWHLALRYVVVGKIDAALELYDEVLAQTPDADWFRLTDATSLLWRLDLIGWPTAGRWAPLAAKWRNYGDRHTSPFLDLHAAMAYAGSGNGIGDDFISSFDRSPYIPSSETGDILRALVKPLCRAMFAFRQEDWCQALALFDETRPRLSDIGGSLAQRHTVDRTHGVAALRAGRLDLARNLYETEHAQRPAAPWALLGLAEVAQREGDEANAEIYNRRLRLALA